MVGMCEHCVTTTKAVALERKETFQGLELFYDISRRCLHAQDDISFTPRMKK
jgi:hypothetical protein